MCPHQNSYLGLLLFNGGIRLELHGLDEAFLEAQLLGQGLVEQVEMVKSLLELDGLLLSLVKPGLQVFDFL